MSALIRLYFISWWRGIIGPFFSIFFPLMMLFLLGQFVPYNVFAPTYVAYCAITLGVQSLAVSLVQFKNSSLIKRIGQTPITRKQFIFSIIVFNFILIIFAICTTLIGMYLLETINAVKIVHYTKVPEFVDGKLEFIEKAKDFSITWDKIQVKFVVMLAIIASFFSIACGIFLGTVCNSAEKANGLALIIYFIMTFLSGIFFPLSYIKNTKSLDFMSRAIPLRPVAQGLAESFKGEYDIFATTKLTTKVVSGHATEAVLIGHNWQWLFYPIILGIILIIISIKLFKWE